MNNTIIKNKYAFIYNKFQYEFYFSKGLVPLKIDFGSKGDLYVQFLNTDELQLAFREWCSKENRK